MSAQTPEVPIFRLYTKDIKYVLEYFKNLFMEAGKGYIT